MLWSLLLPLPLRDSACLLEEPPIVAVPFESELRRVRMPLFITVNMNLSLNFYPGKLPKRVPLRSRLWLWLRPQGVPERWMNIKCLLVPDDFLIVTADSSYHHLRANIVHRANGAEFWHSRPGSNIEDLVLALIGAAYTASDSGGGFG
ncbi:hypothetical protein DL95DRAFT_378034 [Leptodontidium sp. 2 PMI_412]|nr:hypothetical protein DL95DRAFT_378034 [Leptodontidium sp. 2 PMI_412]